MAKYATAKQRLAAQNRKARHNYFIEDTIEAGIVLTGTEVKSLRGGRASIGEAYAAERHGEIWLMNVYIPEYESASVKNHETRRPRKLLLHQREITKLANAVNREGATLVPLDIHFTDRGIAKVTLGLATGKKKQDKRATKKEQDWKRDKARLLRDKG